MMKRSQQVLACAKICAGLATNRRIYLRKQSGRNLKQLDASHVHRREESGEVADYSAPESDHGSIAIRAFGRHALSQLFYRGKSLASLSVSKFKNRVIDLRVRERLLQLRAPRAQHRLNRHHKTPRLPRGKQLGNG